MSSFSYIRATGDSDFNFSYSDFTVEFFVETSNANASPQTLFEITNNESEAANLFSKTRFFTVLENGNINAYATQDVAILYINANANSFTSPVTVDANYRLFYNGQLLESNQYTVSGMDVALSNITISNSNTLASISQILFQVQGDKFSANSMHFVSAERYQNQFYLFLDGQIQKTPVPAYYAIPTQILSNTANANSNITRIDGPALLTIGANKDGQDPLYGLFGDIKITNGNSKHVPYLQPTQSIYSNFPDPFLGTNSSDIVINGGNFVDSITSYGPEELINGQMFDTLFIQVYQSNVSNLSSNILSFILFKPNILVGPVGSYSFTVGTNNTNIAVPWTSLDATTSVLVNGNAIPANTWSISRGLFNANVVIGNNVKIVTSGPTNYYAVGNINTSTILDNVYANTTTINIANVAGFMTPTTMYKGQVFIDQECITYVNINPINNSISGLTRGTSGTGVPEVHIANSRIICAGNAENLQTLTNVDPRIAVWYSSPFNNTSLQNTNTAISNELLTFGGIPPESVF
jgi:hypothetical protein